MLRDMGFQVSLKVITDATAAKAIASRSGLGKTRHIAVHYLWVQERIKRGDLIVKKCWGGENPADLLTKHLSRSVIDKSMMMFGMKVREGRAESAPAIATHAVINCLMPSSRW